MTAQAMPMTVDEALKAAETYISAINGSMVDVLAREVVRLRAELRLADNMKLAAADTVVDWYAKYVELEKVTQNYRASHERYLEVFPKLVAAEMREAALASALRAILDSDGNQAGTAPSDAVHKVPTPKGSLPNSLSVKMTGIGSWGSGRAPAVCDALYWSAAPASTYCNECNWPLSAHKTVDETGKRAV